MKRVLKCVLTALLMLAPLGPAIGAEAGASCVEMQGATPWDELLDRFELICRKCLDLKQRKDAGEPIPSSQLIALMDQLESLRGELKQVSDKMPAYALKRYHAIRQMYSTGVIVETREEMLAGVDCTFLPYGTAALGSYSLPDVTPLPVEPRPLPSVLAVSALISLPELSYGASGAYWGQRFGIWGAVRSTFSHHQAAYEASSDGSFNGGRVWASGKAATDRLFATVGPLVRVSKTVALYGGAGYGVKRLCWEDSNGDWMLIKDASGSGVCYEAGASILIGSYTLSLSWLYLPRTCNTFNLSVGLNLF
jgi:hypothetical protein